MTIISTWCDWCGTRIESLPAVKHTHDGKTLSFCTFDHYERARTQLGLKAANQLQEATR